VHFSQNVIEHASRIVAGLCQINVVVDRCLCATGYVSPLSMAGGVWSC
jgi:hypothetical protein